MSTLLTVAPQASYEPLFVVALVWIGGWLISLWLHPFTHCRACKGTPKQFGAIFTRAFDLCRVCEGRGRRMRMGAQMFSRNRGIK